MEVLICGASSSAPHCAPLVIVGRVNLVCDSTSWFIFGFFRL